MKNKHTIIVDFLSSKFFIRPSRVPLKARYSKSMVFHTLREAEKALGFKRIVYYKLIDGYVYQVETSRVPLFIYHIVRKTALLFDSLGDITCRLLRKLTKEEFNIEKRADLPNDYQKIIQ